MEQALRAVSVARGVDPRGLALVAFGGAGPLHACAPGRRAGHGGGDRPGPGRRALGGRAAVRRPASTTWCGRGPTPADHDGLDEALADAGAARRRPLVGGGGRRRRRPAVDCRYAGQSHELTVPSVGRLPRRARRRNGYARPDAPVEVVALRATARRRRRRSAVADLPAPSRRAGASGPAVIAEPDCTIWVAARAGGPSRRRPCAAPSVRP